MILFLKFCLSSLLFHEREDYDKTLTEFRGKEYFANTSGQIPLFDGIERNFLLIEKVNLKTSAVLTSIQTESDVIFSTDIFQVLKETCTKKITVLHGIFKLYLATFGMVACVSRG